MGNQWKKLLEIAFRGNSHCRKWMKFVHESRSDDITHLGTQVCEHIVVETRLLLGQLGKSDGIIEIEDEIRYRVGDNISIGSHGC